jgi:membrane associated rhomboid family serine protease
MEEWSKKRVLGAMLGGGVVCGIMLWIALGLAGGNLDIAHLPGAILGGLISGYVMHLLG